jgi:Spy/CpxP family protein refolding chaperone
MAPGSPAGAPSRPKVGHTRICEAKSKPFVNITDTETVTWAGRLPSKMERHTMSPLRHHRHLLGVFFMMIAAFGRPLAAGQTRAATPPDSRAPQASTDQRVGQWWRDERIRAGLQLSPAQTDAIQHIFDTSIPAQRDIYASVVQEQKAVDSLLQQDKVDTATALVAMQQLELARCNLNLSRDLMLLRMRQVLTPAQRRTLTTIAPDVTLAPRRP